MKKGNEVDILNGSILKQLLTFFFPILIGTLFQQIYNTTDTVIVGRFVGKEALAAVGGSPFYILSIFVGFSIGCSSGASVIIAQYYGARHKKLIETSVHTSVAFSIILGALMSIVMLIVSRPVLALLKVPADAMEYSVDYLFYVSFGFIFSMIYNMCTGIFRAVGDTRTPLIFLIISCILNIFLDIFFVITLKLNVKGVAIATTIAQFLSAAMSLGVLMYRDTMYRVELRKIRINWHILWKIVGIGVPRGLQSIMYSVANVLLNSTFNLLGTVALAGWAVDVKIESVFWMTSTALGVAITTFTAQHYGARKYKRLLDGLKVCTKLTFGITIGISTVLYIGANLFGMIFTTDTEVLALSTLMLRFAAPFYFFYIGVEMFSGFFYGIGVSLGPVIITALGTWAFRIWWVIFMVHGNPTILGVMVVYPLSWAITSTFFLLYYKINRKRKYLSQKALEEIAA